MFLRTRTVCTQCLFKTHSTSLSRHSLQEARLAQGQGQGPRSFPGGTPQARSTAPFTPRSASSLVAFNIRTLHRKPTHQHSFTQCRGLSAPASTRTTTATSKNTKEKKKSAPSSKDSSTKQDPSTPTQARKKSSKNKPSPKITTSTTAAKPARPPPVKISDYKYSTTSPHQDLDGLQVLVDKLLSTNAVVSKRDILAHHPDQAPLMAWIYDPLRQFYVRPASFIKYAQRWAKQQDEALAVVGAAVKSTTASHTLNPRNDGTSASGSGATNLSHLDDGEAASGTNSRAEQAGQRFNTLPSLLEALSTRSITGNASMGAIMQFMDRFCGPTGSTSSSFEAINSSSPAGSYSRTLATLLSTPRSKLFLKILGRNLKTGCSVGIIREVYPTLIPGFHVALGQMLKLDEAEVLFDLPNSSQEKSTEKTNSGKTTKKRKTKETMSDLSATTSPNNINAAEWIGSRKLDGVRCLMRIDRRTGNITALSRAGKEFDGMGKILDSLRTIVKMGQSGDDDIRGRDEFFRQALGVHDSDDDKKSPLPDALILDGEMCVFVAEPIQETSTTTNGNSQSSPLIVGLLEDDGLGREIFTKAITFVTRGAIEDPFMDNLDNEDVKYSLDDPTASATTSTDGSEDIALEYDRPLYCIFDCLTDKEFKDRQGTRPLLERIHGLTRALIQSEGVVRDSGGLVKVLCQTKVESYEQLQKMVARGVERGWEGVMLRKNTGYEGKRSRNLLKLKQFHEAEFTVEEAMLGTMRLPLRGEFEERDNVLTSVVVVHRGNRVRVGSGFSAEERIRLGKDPSLIVGKTITVKYFEESKTYSGSSIGGGSGGIGDEASSVTSSERMFGGGGGGATRAKSSITADNTDDDDDDKGDRGGDIIWSLRFPTVKAIYGQGPRQL